MSNCPARAGFTEPAAWAHGLTLDHPRSRGVYPASRPASPRAGGSSPLARGLPPQRRRGAPHTRIIPARAGFTLPVGRLLLGQGDHPRSRGVYRSLKSLVMPPHGSSPLARGLRGARQVQVGLGRIIPARAGFTSSSSPQSARKPDHPRSRGVYEEDPYVEAMLQGSSPLARGLP